jgi:hypothetical protein
MDVYKTIWVHGVNTSGSSDDDIKTTHECFVCGDTIDLTAQVCSRYCMRAMEQMTVLDSLDSLEAQVETRPSSDYAESPVLSPSSSPTHKIVPEQRAVPVLIEVNSCLSYSLDTPRPYTLD